MLGIQTVAGHAYPRMAKASYSPTASTQTSEIPSTPNGSPFGCLAPHPCPDNGVAKGCGSRLEGCGADILVVGT